MTKRMWDLFLVIAGSIIMGGGIAFEAKSKFGLDALSLFNEGMGKLLGVPLGTASQLVVVSIIVILFFIDKKRVGIGSVANGVLVGASANFFMPIVNQLNENFTLRIIMLIIGILLVSIGIGIYVSAGLGEGGFDAWMMFAADKLKKEVRFVRITMDICLVAIGTLLGGSIGLGTLIATLSYGPIIQFTLNTMNKLRKQTHTNNPINE
ncbi:YczE/YyaS/YitT family protein [Lacrimispora algidixylanolytica]|uniref:YitT family protein n=1 Tax=Lacrimispora algidixylanolytica TaxID=94868 RepID=A0A419T0S7_9FIRM|nr:hypothetical protein [Lacrimispora algidixylanolytica]RKD31062.1 hypothetical protein BET01_04195 [Lacrimispora algidixylanolytica]